MRTKFYTKAGDKGSTVMGKKTLAKDNDLFNVLGMCDQLNSWLGIIKATYGKKQSGTNTKVIEALQDMLFICMAEIAQAYFSDRQPRVKILNRHTAFLEETITGIDKRMPALKHFVAPGGTLIAAQFDYARTLARNLERAAVGLNRRRRVSTELMKFLNRLSSTLFALARFENYRSKCKERAPRYSV